MLVLVALSAVSIASTQNTFAQSEVGMSVTAMAEDGSDRIMISGETMSQRNITFTITSPSSNNVVDVGQVQPDMDGSAVSIASTQNTFAQSEVGMSVTAMAEDGSDRIMISGETMSQRNITFTITSPSSNNVVDVGQVQPDMDGKFATTFAIGNLWKENGFYSITAKQGNASLYEMTVFVQINDGMAMATSETVSNLESGMFAQTSVDSVELGLSIEANAMVGSTTIEITGKTDKKMEDVTLTVTAPNGNRVSVDQVTPDSNGTFTAEITTGGPLWNDDGDYTVSAQQTSNPKYIDSVIVEIEDGVVVPEFGTIAIMILAVAIISIIAISARSRLSIMPRY